FLGFLPFESVILGCRVGAEPHELNVIKYRKRQTLTNDRTNGFVGIIVSDKSILFKSLLSLVDLVTFKHRQKIGKQGEKGGDFLGGFPKKYNPNLACRLAIIVSNYIFFILLMSIYYSLKNFKNICLFGGITLGIC